MAPKSSNAGKEKLIDDEEEVLQAVILADSFNKRFRPLTARKPRCLLPICNAPLLDWTFESLALAGVQEIFVICRSHAELVKTAIKESKWSKPGSGIKIVPILTAKETFSPGDAMRDIYTRGLVTSDFVLVMGDLVSNIRIDEVVRVHKERRKTNKDAIMTMVVKESGARHRTKARGDSSVFILDPETSECLYYEPVSAFPQTTFAHIPREILADHPEVEIRNDLIDCSIDVCSVEVPSLFQDNFDYLDIRRDFVHGVLTSDLLMKNIHCYVAKDGYAARVKDTKSYESVSKDILSRWTFPLVPDDNHPGGHVYDHERGNKYIAKDNTVVLARTCKIGNNTLIGSSTNISANVQVLASVIGQNCNIGAGAIIRNSYVFDGAVIGSDCVVERSIIGANVNVKDGSEIQKGCLLADGVVVGPSAKLKPFLRLSKKPEEKDELVSDEDEDDDSDLEDLVSLQVSLAKDLGTDSNALVWPTAPEEDADDDEIAKFKNERFMRLGDDASDLDYSDDGSESSLSESESDDESDSDADFTVPSESLPLGLPDGSPMVESEFQIEVKQSLERAFAEGHSVDNAAVELKTLRMASNVPLTRVREAVVGAIVDKIKIVDSGVVEQRKEIAAVIARWGQLIDRIGGVDPVETVSALQAHCASSQRLPLFGQILAALYQDDIVEEDDIRKWHRLPVSRGEGLKNKGDVENFKKCWTVGSHMIKQFDEQESSEEEDEDEEDEKGDENEEDKSKGANQAKKVQKVMEESEEESEESDGEPNTSPAKSVSVASAISPNQEATSEEESEEDEDIDEIEEVAAAPTKPMVEDVRVEEPIIYPQAIATPQITAPSSTNASQQNNTKQEPQEESEDEEEEDEDEDEDEEESDDGMPKKPINSVAGKPDATPQMAAVPQPLQASISPETATILSSATLVADESDDESEENSGDEVSSPGKEGTQITAAVAPVTPLAPTSKQETSEEESSEEESDGSDGASASTNALFPMGTHNMLPTEIALAPPFAKPESSGEESEGDESEEYESGELSEAPAVKAAALVQPLVKDVGKAAGSSEEGEGEETDEEYTDAESISDGKRDTKIATAAGSGLNVGVVKDV